MNYLVVGFVIFLAVVILVLIIVKNEKDKKKILHEMSQSELKAEKHNEEESEN